MADSGWIGLRNGILGIKSGTYNNIVITKKNVIYGKKNQGKPKNFSSSGSNCNNRCNR
jgi:hypothetical protein